MTNAVAEQLPNQNEQLDKAKRIYNDTITWSAEVLNGSMRTSFEYWYNGIDLVAEDGGLVTNIFDDAIASAEVICRQQPGLHCELRRRLIERGELDDMLSMACGELPNTMVVVSDFPAELMQSDEDIGGYNTKRRQTMLRVITKQTDGTIKICSQSLDQSNRQALESIYELLGTTAEPGELLAQRLFLDLPAPWQDQLIGRLTDRYDESMQTQFGGSWHAGILQQPNRQFINTYDFACSQTDLIDWFSQLKLADPLGAEGYRLQLAATMSSRFEKYCLGQSGLSRADITSMAGYDLSHEIEFATQRALMLGQIFSGCGISVGGETTSPQLEALGYGNKSSEACEYVSKECPLCHTKNVRTRVSSVGNGQKHIKGSCGCSKIS